MIHGFLGRLGDKIGLDDAQREQIEAIEAEEGPVIREYLEQARTLRQEFGADHDPENFDEQAFRAHCAATGQPYNPHHKHETFSLATVKETLRRIGHTRLVHEVPLVDVYSWELVAEKTG